MKVLVIGLDGVTFDLLGPWIEAGELPNLQRLMDQGAWGTLRTTLPPISSSSWSSFLTGVNPGKHGLVDFVYPGADSYKVTMINATSRRTRAVWNWLNDAGLKVGLAGHPHHLPARAGGWFYDQRFSGAGPRQRVGLPARAEGRSCWPNWASSCCRPTSAIARRAGWIAFWTT